MDERRTDAGCATGAPGTGADGHVQGGRPSLIGEDAEGLARRLAELGVAARERGMRARQLFRWIYARGARSFEIMSDLPKDLRDALAERFELSRPQVLACAQSRDGTRKWLLGYEDGARVELVYIPEPGRGTLCLSSQVGCPLGCRFCRTATMGLWRNLRAGEILGQILFAKDALDDWPADRPGRQVTNLVLMGMGEPLLNYEAVRQALRVALARDGLGLSRRRITVSTAGVVPRIAELGRDLGVRLAVSLHAADDATRDRLVPINRKWNIAALLEACRNYPAGRRITFEYVLLHGVNDRPEDARRLVRLLADLPAKVNLIPFNPWPGSEYRPSSAERVRRFRRLLEAGGLEAPVREPRGRDILAACGQLASAPPRSRAA